MPLKAGIQSRNWSRMVHVSWTPAFAGVTGNYFNGLLPAPRSRSFEARALSQDGVYRRGIFHAPTLLQGSGVVREACFEERRGDPERPAVGPDDVDVLLVDLRLHVRGQVVARDHERTAHLKHARGAGAIPNHPVQELQVEPGLLAQ